MQPDEEFEKMKKSFKGIIRIDYEGIDYIEAMYIAKWYLTLCERDIKNAKKSFTYRSFIGKTLTVYSRYRDKRLESFVIVIREKL